MNMLKVVTIYDFQQLYKFEHHAVKIVWRKLHIIERKLRKRIHVIQPVWIKLKYV